MMLINVILQIRRFQPLFPVSGMIYRINREKSLIRVITTGIRVVLVFKVYNDVQIPSLYGYPPVYLSTSIMTCTK